MSPYLHHSTTCNQSSTLSTTVDAFLDNKKSIYHVQYNGFCRFKKKSPPRSIELLSSLTFHSSATTTSKTYPLNTGPKHNNSLICKFPASVLTTPSNNNNNKKGTEKMSYDTSSYVDSSTQNVDTITFSSLP